MTKLLILLATACGLMAQYATILGSDYPANSRTQLNLKPASRVGAGAPSGSCTAGLDFYVNSSTTDLWYCEAANTWSLVNTGGRTWGGITGTLSNQTDLQSALDGKLATGGTAALATALAANGANCSAGSFPLGVDASGAAESCTALPTTISGTANQITASASTGPVTLSLPATITGLSSVTSTAFVGNVAGNASTATALQTSRTIAGVSFDGTANISIASTGLSDTANIVRNNASNTYIAGMRQIFGSSATTAGVGFTGMTVDPSSVAAGDMWYRTDLGTYGFRNASAVDAFVAGGRALPTVCGVPFVTAAGVVGSNASNFCWDNSNTRLGIGTNAPSKNLHVVVAAASSTGAIRISESGSSRGVELRSPTSTTSGGLFNTSTGESLLIYAGSSGNIRFGDTGEYARFAATTGNFLIGGTTDGGYKLGVQSSGTSGTARFYDQAGGGSTIVAVRAGASQSGNLMEWQNNAGTALVSVSSTGFIKTDNIQDLGGAITITVGGVAAQYLGATNFQIKPTSGFQISPGDSMTRFGGTTSSFPALKRSSAILQARLADDSAFAAFNASSSTFYNDIATTGSTLVTVRAGAGQSGNLMEWQNNTGAVLLSVNSAGSISGSSVSVFFGGYSTISGGYYEWSGRSLFRSPINGVVTLSNNAETDFNRLQFGGTTSSFGALARAGAGLAVKLADDSAYSSLIASRLQVSPVAVSALATCNSGSEGSTQAVTDSNTVTWGATVAGGGSNRVQVRCNGTNWTVVGI